MKPCPKCDYDLTGLPEVHRCPECGFDYDPHVVLIRSDEGRRSRGSFVTIAAGAVLICHLYITGSWDVGALRPALLLALYLGLAARYAMNAHKAVEMVLLNRYGLTIIGQGAEALTTPWKDICSSQYRWVDGSLRVLGRNGSAVVTLSYTELRNARTARSFAADINRLKAVYAGYEP